MLSFESRKKWILPTDEESIAGNELAEKLDLLPEVAGLLLKRGISETEIADFLNPDLKNLPDVTELYDAKKASEQILKAIKDSKKIFIHGDFDADGISATAILWEFLYKTLASELDTKVDCTPYIPDRVDEGYGLSEQSVESMIEQGAQLIISVDCGIRDKKVIQSTKKKYKGVEIIVTDHHQPPEDLLTNLDYTVVHPSFPEKQFPFPNISGAAVAWLLVQNLRKVAKVTTFSETNDGLDLVALSTVTDMMPLTGLNRIFVSEGLKVMHKGKRIGLNKLAKLAGVEVEALDSYHLGFVIGPRINAAGRIGSPMEALRLLLTNDNVNALRKASIINAKNTERQQLTESILREAKLKIAKGDKDSLLNFIYGNEWPEGIVGLVAGKLVEEFGKPAIVVTVRNNEARGSARSFGGLNITKELEKHAEILTKYGGHAQAAGFSLLPENLEKFQAELLASIAQNYTSDQFLQELKVDLLLEPDQIDLELSEKLLLLKPYGFGNPTPMIVVQDLKIRNIIDMGKKGLHMKIEFEEVNNNCEYICFNCPADFDKLEIGKYVDIAGTVSVNEWNGNKKTQLIIKEWKIADARIF